MRICCINLGCKVNQYEIDSMANELKKDHEVFTELCVADIYIVNTCAVTSEAEKKSRQFVAKITALNKDAKILICGCASQNNPKQFEDKPNVKVIMGIMGKTEITKYLNDTFTDVRPLDHKNYEDNFFVDNCNRIRGYVKIQDGCNNFCNYCLIPYLRGRSRSRDYKSIISEIKALSSNVKEIVLTGINMSDYRIDGELALTKLFRMLKDIPVRLRIGSLEVNVVTRDLLETLKSIDNFCPHFHLSLQNGCDKVLKEMNRHYTSSEYLDKVNLIREYFPYAGITTDLIVGYPTETDEDFELSKQFLSKVKFSAVHYFAYSSREGTVASRLKQINGTIIKNRELALKPLVNDLKTQFIELNQAVAHDVLIEERIDDYLVGYTRNYIRCYIASTQDLINTIVKVKLIQPYKDGALAEIIED